MPTSNTSIIDRNTIDWIINRYNDDGLCVYKHPQLSEYFKIAVYDTLLNNNPNINIANPGSLKFYKEIQIAIDYMSGILDYISGNEKYKQDSKVDHKIIMLYDDLLLIYEEFIKIIPATETKFFGKYTVSAAVDRKDLIKNIFK